MRLRLGDARRALSLLRRGPTGAPAAPAAPAPAPPVVGMVEEFTRRRVVGWLSVARHAAPVRVDLVLDDLVVASTFATPGASMTGIDTAPQRRAGIPGPDGDRRNSARQIRTFSFRVQGIWPYVRRTTRITLRVDGHPLPIHRHGLFLRPRARGPHTLDDLREKFAQGHLLDQMGHVSLDRTLDEPWQRSVMALYGRVRTILRDDFDHDIFLVYGTLLGAVREGGPIGHDFDFDAAYLSRHRSGAEAATQLEEVAMALVNHGLDVECYPRALHVVDPEDPDHRIDLFHCYFDDAGEIAFPFGVAGTSRFTAEDWKGLEPIRFMGADALVPVDAERLVAHLYGEDWRSPKPGFNWDLDRTGWAVAGHLSEEQRMRVHWANFYSRSNLAAAGGSSFSAFVVESLDLPHHLVDLGSGDGRDTCALAAAGHQVLGLDASSEGVARGVERARGLGLLDRTGFATCDVADGAALREHLDGVRGAAEDGPVGFYLRFFLHAIPEHAQDQLLDTLVGFARPGDWFLAEFRTRGDETSPKAHGKHYRRFIDAGSFREELEQRHGFSVVDFTESRGLSPYGEEDPMLCRIVARRADGQDAPTPSP